MCASLLPSYANALALSAQITVKDFHTDCEHSLTAQGTTALKQSHNRAGHRLEEV